MWRETFAFNPQQPLFIKVSGFDEHIRDEGKYTMTFTAMNDCGFMLQDDVGVSDWLSLFYWVA